MNTETTTTEIATGFPVLFTKEDFTKNIVEALLVLANQTYFTFSAVSGGSISDIGERVWSLLSTKPYHGSTFSDSGTTPEDVGLTFADVERLSIVQTLMQLYDYGMQGILDTSIAGDFDTFDGYENQVSRIFYDLNRSTFLQEWGNYGAYSSAVAVDRCGYVFELANARLMLEGGSEGFFLDDREEGSLSIRQMALLSGMTEASIRTLASRSRKSQLTATSDSNSQLITTNDGKNTSIDIADAKAWLKAKGRYVAISRMRNRGATDFTNRKFGSMGEIEDAISDRLEFLKTQYGDDVISARIESVGVVPVRQQIVPPIDMWKQVIGEEQLLETELMRSFGEALELPADLFALRAAEAVMQEKLRGIEKQVKQAQQLKS
jgi:hypothetical protein